ncbi:MAG: UTP--glucose-1-phosphate uridylyltransferase GalU [Anaeroplasmataceae bacterium]
MKKIRKAIIPAAGYGTRFLPVTKAIAKEMLPIIDTPAIEFIVREAIESGIEDILIVVSANKNAIIDYFDNNFELEYQLKEKGKLLELSLITELPSKINIHFIRQHEQLGLGHAVLCAKAFVSDEPFAVLLGDDVYVGKDEPALKQLINAYEKTNSSILGTLEVSDEDVSKYGICSPSKVIEKGLAKLNDVVEKPALKDAPSKSAIGGRYILTPEIFAFLKDQQKGAGNEIQLTDAIRRMMKKSDVYSYDIIGTRYDIGSKIGFIEATIDFALKNNSLKEDVLKLIKSKI